MPEVLAQNGLTLPVGTECDACNEYAGKKLEINLARYPNIAVAIQFLGTPGKRGKPRQEIGGVHRRRVDAKHVRVNLRVRGQLAIGPDGKHLFTGHVPPVADFNFLGFRRALHHIGLNYVAAANGPLAALDEKYDPVRRYVKDPRPASESWPYGQVHKNELPRLVAVGFIEYEGAEFVWIHIFQTIFVIDLLNSGALADLTRALGGTFVPADAESPPPAVLTAGDR